MSLLPPPYVPIQEIETLPLSHSWDDWDPYVVLPPADEFTVSQLDGVHNMGITAFAIGCAEWVVYRFGKHCNDSTPYNYIEAYWAYVMGHEDVDIPVTEHDEWTGVVRGPISLALMTVMNTVFLSEDGPPSEECGIAEQTVLHVLPQKTLFLEWRDAVLERLGFLCARDEANPDGSPVPREILDPSVALTPESLGELTEHFLAELDYDANPHINPPPSTTE